MKLPRFPALLALAATLGVGLFLVFAPPADRSSPEAESAPAASPSQAASTSPALPADLASVAATSSPTNAPSSRPSASPAPPPPKLPRANHLPADPAWPVGPQVKLLLGAEPVASADPVLQPDGSATRERIVRTRDFKYPLLRVIETFRPHADGSGFDPRPALLLSVADHVLVRPARPLSPSEASALARSIGGSVRRVLPLSGNVLVAFDGARPGALAAAHAALALHPLVQIAEPDHLYHTLATFPADPDFAKLYGLHNTGQPVNFTASGAADADIDAPEAWDITTGSRDVVVAVLDTGVDYNHPDLKDNIALNLGEIPGNGIDDDANGFIDDYFGWDFAEDDNNPFDGHSHGTHCAGTVGASADNATGIVGVAWRVRILPIKFLDDGGSGTGSDAIEAIHYSRVRGVRITSNSWGGSGQSDTMKAAVDQTATIGQIFVAAAGNNGDNVQQFPAAYPGANILSVAASDNKDSLASFSSFDDGTGWVDVAAPGVDIYSTMPGGGYAFKSGTSMATPHVAGLMGLIRSIQPDLSPADAIAWVKTTVDTKSSLTGKVATGGRVNAYKALYDNINTPLLNLVSTTCADTGDANGIPNPGETITLTTHLRNVSSIPATAVQATLTLAAPDPYVAITGGSASLGDFPSLAQKSAAFTFTVAAGAPTPRTVTLRLATVDAAGHARVIPIPVTLYTMSAVTGTVREIDGSPVPAATVSYTGPLRGEVATAADGAHALSLVDGSHELRVSKSGYTPSAARLVRVPPAASGIDFVLARPRVRTSATTLAAVVGPDGRATLDVPLLNDGTAPAAFTVREMQYGHDRNGSPGGPVYNWIDISATGAALEVPDLAFNQYEYFNAGPLPLGMDFPFYENSFRSFRVNQVGWISFTNASRSVFDYRVELPDHERPENLIAFAWTGSVDWTHWKPGDVGNPNYVAGARRLFHQQVDPQTHVITAHRWATGEYDLLTSQIVLKRDGTILLQYGPYTNSQGGAGGTFHPGPLYFIAGMQDAEGRRGQTPVLGPSRIIPTNGTVIRMRPVVGAPWLRTDRRNGVLQPGAPATSLRVTLDATGLAAGTYSTKLVLDSDDASRPSLEIPVTLTVGAGETSLARITPADQANLPPGSTLPLAVRIIGSAASVTGVNFYNGSTLLGAGVFTGPDRYTFAWANIPAGSLDLVAVAALSDGRTVSTPVRPASAGTGFRVAIDAVDSSATTPAIGYHRALVERFGTPFINFATAENTVYARHVTITRSGSTATVAIPASYLMRFGYFYGVPVTETMTISGAAQPEYNGTHTLAYSAFNSPNYLYTFPVSGTPASPSTGAHISDFARMVVSEGGRTLRMSGQGSRKIALPATYNVTANTVLEFDFLGSNDNGTGVFGVGLDNDNALSAARIFQVWGKKTNYGSNRAHHNYVEDNFDSNTPRWRHYRIPVGQHFTGAQNFLVLLQTNEDWYYRHDADATYRNITLYEDPDAAGDYTHQWTVTDAPSTRAGEQMTHAWLQPGEKTVSLVTTLGTNSATATRTIQVGGSGVFAASVNFQPANAFTPVGFVPDTGNVFADRLNGYTYGWIGSANPTAVDADYPIQSQFQERDTYIRQTTDQTWEIAVPNGTYRLYASAGFALVGATSNTSSNWLRAEGVTVIDKNLAKDQFTDGLATATVADGRLTLTSHRNTAYVNYLNLVRTDGANIAPVAAFTATALGGVAPVHIAFDASASYVNNGAIASYAWDFGDGATATGVSPSHTFASPGPRTVTLTVTDATGASARTTTALAITGAPQVAASLALAPATATLATGGTRQLAATVLDQFGQPLFPQPAVAWQVSGGGSITASGLFTAGPTPGGPHTVTATSGALSDTAAITLVAALSTTVTVSPSATEVPANGGAQVFHATVFDQFGQPINPQPAVAWSVSGGGSINSTGLFTAGPLPGGPHTITATSGAASGTAQITVTAALPVPASIVVSPATPTLNIGLTQQFSAVVYDQYNQVLAPQPAVAWSVSGGGTINSTGLFTAGPTPGGPHAVTATVGAVSGATTINLVASSVLFSTTFNAAASTSLDSVTVAGTSRQIAWTGSGSNAPAPAGFWSVTDPAKVDLYGLPNGQLTFGGVTYGNNTTNNGPQKGAIFMVGNRTSFAHADNLAALNMSGDYVARSNTSSLHDTAFGVLFEIKPSAGGFTGWQLAYNYGTNGGSWVNNTADAQGSTTALIYKVGAGNVLDPVPVATFTTVNLAGAGPLAQLTASSSAVGPGVYLLKIDMFGKTNAQRYSIDNLSLSAAAAAPPPPLLTPYEEWQITAFPEGTPAADLLPTADPDADGLPNLLEYALDLDPLAPSPEPHVRITNIGAALSIQFLRARPELTYEVLASSTLAPDSWQVIATNPGSVSLTVPVTVTDPAPVSENPRRFLRLRVTQSH